jgi:DNA-binding response OmpR family regulator
VLILGHIRELALYRAEVLRSHGFNVATPRTEEEMKAAIRRGNFDVAVLSYTLPNDTVEEMAELMREYCRDCTLVAITDTGRVDRKISPDEVVLADDGPGALIEALHRVTRSH